MGKYWKIFVDEVVCGDMGISLTEEQSKELAEQIYYARDMEFEATGQHHIPNPLETENKKLAAELKREKNACLCKSCNGSGHVEYMSGPWHVSSSCDECSGKGKVYQ